MDDRAEGSKLTSEEQKNRQKEAMTFASFCLFFCSSEVDLLPMVSIIVAKRM